VLSYGGSQDLARKRCQVPTACWTGAQVFSKDFNFVKKYHLVSVLWLISSMNGQNLVDLRTQTKNVNFSGAASTIPAQTGTTLPATCTPGQLFFNTGSTPGQNLYACAPANTWTVLGGSSGSGTVSSATAGQFWLLLCRWFHNCGAYTSGGRHTRLKLPNAAHVHGQRSEDGYFHGVSGRQ